MCEERGEETVSLYGQQCIANRRRKNRKIAEEEFIKNEGNGR